MAKKFVLLATVMAASSATWSAEARLSASDLASLSPQQQAHWAKAKAAFGQPSPQYNYDITAPTLQSARVTSTVNASLKGAQAVVTLAVRENLSGLATASVTLEGPAGQQVWQSWSSNYPRAGRQTVQVAVGMDAVSQNGTWKIKAVQVADANGYSTLYDEAALAAMGANTFEVVKAAGDTAQPSVLSGGTNLTPVVSRSAPPAGMLPGANPRVGMQLMLQDVGSAGVQSVSVSLCHESYWYECIYLSGNTQVRGQTNLSMVAGGYVNSWRSLGNYVVDNVSVQDFSGNYRSYYRGDPALSTLLDVTTVQITE